MVVGSSPTVGVFYHPHTHEQSIRSIRSCSPLLSSRLSSLRASSYSFFWMPRMVPETLTTLSPLIMKMQASRLAQWSLGTRISTLPRFMYFTCSEKVILARKSSPSISSETCFNSLRKPRSLVCSAPWMCEQSARMYLFLKRTMPSCLQIIVMIERSDTNHQMGSVQIESSRSRSYLSSCSQTKLALLKTFWLRAAVCNESLNLMLISARDRTSSANYL